MTGYAEEQAPPEPKAASVVPKTRMFSIAMRYAFANIPKDIQSMDYWFPLPFDNDQQKIYHRFSHAPYVSEINEAPDTGNLVMHMKGSARGGVPMQVKISFDVARFEDLRNTFEPAKQPLPPEEEKKVMERWLQPETMIVVDKAARSKAGKITSGKKQPIDKARAIYDYILDNMTFVEDVSSVRGAGFGNFGFALSELKGNSMDFAAAFVGLCRAAGIPARTIIGVKIPTDMETGEVKGYHGWAEFYVAGIGWIPVDPAEGKLVPSRRKYYFGALDPDRLAFSAGRDIELIPPQAGPPLNYLVNPYWEGDTKEMPTPYIEIKFTNLDEIPSSPSDEAIPVGGQTPVPPGGGGR